ncbi:MAG: arsenosugar biosynthesis radical SAM protein ArsS [Thiohalobacterales bacterium]|nr:arsenosugar biosynthesis radical SAM protein ArsS [Thiohalobacterales bacterium]
MHATLPLLQQTDFPSLTRTSLATLQVNLGYRCNQSCLHCHVNAGPNRTEIMERQTIDAVIAFIDGTALRVLDLTGGAPELNPHFRYLVRAARARGLVVIDRCNLTVLLEPGQHGTAGFLAENRVKVVASLPCYSEENVDTQRGEGSFGKSLEALRQLNDLGYGRPGSGRELDLVYNPQGPVLPPPQQSLEQDYKRRLAQDFGIVFNGLLTIANMPIKRFGSTLVSRGEFDSYMQLLRDAHQDANLDAVMCRSLISVDWQGHVYDCDFNQMLDLPMAGGRQGKIHISDLAGADLAGRPITVADHCYACTAGQGSSCGGALDSSD